MNFKYAGLILISIALIVGLLSLSNFYPVLFWEYTSAKIDIRMQNSGFNKNEINMELSTTLIRACAQSLYFALMSVCFFISGVILLNKNRQVD